MPALMFQCKNCGTIFSFGVDVDAGATVIFTGSRAQCPSCGSMENIPDGTFKGTVEGIVEFLSASKNPLQEARKIFDVLENSRKKSSLEEITKQPWYSSLSKWLPNTPEKLAAYAAIISAVIQILSKNPGQKIEYNQTFINLYNQTIVIQNHNPTSLPIKKQKIGRNEPCPCGNGKKYKHCHGK